jgi:hypothetical protein
MYNEQNKTGVSGSSPLPPSFISMNCLCYFCTIGVNLLSTLIDTREADLPIKKIAPYSDSV